MAREKTKLLSDFSGGLNQFFDPNRIQDNQLAAMDNVYWEYGGLTKRLGSTNTSIPAYVHNSAATGTMQGWELELGQYISAGSTIFNLYVCGNSTSDCQVAIFNGSTWSNPSYTTGNAATTINNTAVTGSGTAWSTNVKAGDLFKSNADGTFVRIATVNSDTSLTLVSNYPSTNASGAYTITPAWKASSSVVGNSSSLRTVFFNNTAYVYSSYDIAATTISINTSGVYTLVSAFPNVRHALVYKNYVFGLGTSANPARVSWSALKDATTWPASNFVDIAPNDGQYILGGFLDGQSIVVIKNRSAYKVTGDIFDPTNPSYTVTPIAVPQDFGISSHRVVQFFNERFVMLGHKGLYEYFGGNEISLLQASTKGTLSSNAQWFNFQVGFITASNAEQTSIVKDGRYFVAGKSLAANNAHTLCVLDSQNNLWQWDAVNQSSPQSWSDFIYNPNNNTYNYVDANNQGLATWDSTTFQDAGVGGTKIFNATATTKVFEFPNQQHFMQAYVYFKKQSAGNLTFSYAIDEGTFTDVTVDMTSGTGTRVKSNPLVIGQVGYSIQFKVTNGTNNGMTIYGIEFSHRELDI